VAPDQSPEANRHRINRLERDVENLEKRLEDYGALKQTVVNLDKAVANLQDELKAVRRALYTAALTVGGSAVLLAVSILASKL
jgi:predicted  nucleic acid-binding Zn-ribbon protein